MILVQKVEIRMHEHVPTEVRILFHEQAGYEDRYYKNGKKS